jgi:elongation factor 1-beta
VIDSAAYPHVARWAKHIASYPTAALAAPAAAAAPAAPAASNDDDDMFGEDDDEEEMRKEMEKAKIAAAHAAKKPKKEVIAKSTVVFDVKPFEAETDMAELEACVRAIVVDGLIWGASKLEDVAYGVKKLVINTVVEDDKVSIDDLQDAMCALKDGELVQSTEIVAFNKI